MSSTPCLHLIMNAVLFWCIYFSNSKRTPIMYGTIATSLPCPQGFFKMSQHRDENNLPCSVFLFVFFDRYPSWEQSS